MGKKSTSGAAFPALINPKNIPMTTGMSEKSVVVIAASAGLFPNGAMMNIDQLVRERPERIRMMKTRPKFVAVKSVAFQTPAMMIHEGR